MDKIYGYKEKDIIGLGEMLNNRKDMSLTEIFSSYGKKCKKSGGTIRNLYYAVAKRSREDQEFADKYFNGEKLSVNKIVAFDEEEERELIRKILIYKSQGSSVRSAILRLAGGDEKTALRYQNKYRNSIKNNQPLVKEIVNQLKEKGINVSVNNKKKEIKVNEENYEKLKEEIDGLYRRIGEHERKENKRLKEKVYSLERENLKLMKILYGESDYMNVEKYFNRNNNKKIEI